jgi:hypothetical protein
MVFTMNPFLSRPIHAVGLLLALLANAPAEGADRAPSLAPSLQQRLDAFHADAPDNDETLRLVYFHPKDTKPQKDYQARIERIVLDIQDFLDTEMKRIGFDTRPHPHEKDDKGKLIHHHLAGKDASIGYTYANGGKVRRELEEALDGPIDFDNDFVLVFGGMCKKQGENRYFFHSPYYGDGSSNHRRGLCYAADCELLDTQNLKKTDEKIVYREHQGEFTRNLADFNSLYIGGIAHELGHGLSLPHNGEWPSQRAELGTALMGSGNFTYRKERWSNNKGSFMTPASATRLAAHPLFTGSDRARNTPAKYENPELNFKAEGQSLTVSGKVDASPEALAVILYSDPEGGSDYDAKTWVTEVKDGAFTLTADSHQPGPHELRLTLVHMNGATTTLTMPYLTDEKGHPSTGSLTAVWNLRAAERLFLAGKIDEAVKLAAAALENNPGEPAAAKLQHLITLADPPKPQALTDITADTVFLSDLVWSAAETEWGKPTRNQYFIGGPVRDAVFLELANGFHPKGLYAHATSRYTFDLDGQWKTFEATVGLQVGAAAHTGAQFIVKGDGQTLFTSNKLTGPETQKITASVDGVQILELIAQPGAPEDTPPGFPENGGCWTIWASPRHSP